MANLQIDVCETMSRLAWCARISPGGRAKAVVGPWVEHDAGFLVEGVWGGEFQEPDFDLSYSFMGSGIKIRDQEVVVVAPCHTTEAVYSLHHNDDILFSNSIPLILKIGDASLDLQYLDYEADFSSASEGIQNYVKHTPLANGRQLDIHYYTTIHVGSDLSLRFSQKPACQPFKGYEEYEAFLIEELKIINRNATDKRRKKTYTPIVFCSNGYDSSACAVLGTHIGCNEAVVFESKRGFRSDSGREIVERLGYTTIHEREERGYMQQDDAHLFLSTGELGTAVYMLAASAELEGKMLLNGVYGDVIWDRNNPPQNPDLIRLPDGQTLPNGARKEFRLANGHLNVLPASITASRYTDLHVIANSPEMADWQLNNEYDRPIPRRMVEEAGMPRDLFGFHKDGGTASSMRFGVLSTLKNQLPAGSFNDFVQYYRHAKSQRRLSATLFIRSAIYPFYAGATLLSLYGRREVTRMLRTKDWPFKYKCSPFAPSFLFPWAVEEVQNRLYADAEL